MDYVCFIIKYIWERNFQVEEHADKIKQLKMYLEYQYRERQEGNASEGSSLIYVIR